MELVTLGLGYIVKVFASNQEVKDTVDDFVSQSVSWVRSWFLQEDHADAITKLEAEPNSESAKVELKTAMGQMINNDQFKMELEKWVKEHARPMPSMKNVLEDVEINVEGNINIGDKTQSDEVYDKKNVIQRGKITGGGDFNLGDIG